MSKKKAAKVLTRKDGSQKKEQDAFMFSSALKSRLFSDYIALKLNYHQEPLTLAFTILVQMIEVVEKALKLFLANHLKCQDCLAYFGSNFGHDINKLRKEAAKIDTIFDDDDIVSFCNPLDDKKGRLYQYLRYGSHFNIEGMSTDLNKLMPIVTKIFYSCITRLDEHDKRMINFNSLIFNLLVYRKFDQSKRPDLLLGLLAIDAPYFEEYKAYCEELKVDHDKQLEEFGKRATS